MTHHKSIVTSCNSITINTSKVQIFLTTLHVGQYERILYNLLQVTNLHNLLSFLEVNILQNKKNKL